MKTVIISAVEFEAKPTLELLRRNNIPHEYFQFGIGPLNATKSLNDLLKISEGQNVLYLGSAGTFGHFDSPHLVTSEEVIWMPTAERMGLAKHMVDLHKPIKIPPIDKFDLPKRTVLTSSSVSFSGAISVDGLPDKELLVENMEMYAVIPEILSSAKRFQNILGITNKVGPEGSVQWFKNFKSIANMTAEYIESNFDSLLSD